MKLYHRTSTSSADQIIRTGNWQSQEHDSSVYFSTASSGSADGYGPVVLMIDIDPAIAMIDDEFPDGEQHYRVYARDLVGVPVLEVPADQ
ncbi:hypothetical protein [Gordonia sihwensis]|uniref:hypothetical protein n=1 Tax=Gordonia sihwensis TaxID=173559 RepID=UPI003D954AEF